MNLRKTLVTLCICSLLALSLVVGAKPAWQKYKAWRAESLLAESAQFERDGSLVVAFQKAHAAFMLSRETPEAGRRVAQLAVQVRHPGAIAFWDTVVSSEAATSDDFASAIESALGLRRSDKVIAWMEAWRRAYPNETRLPRQRIDILILASRGELAACREHITRLRTAYPNAIPPSIVLLEARITLALDPTAGATLAGELFLEAGRAPTVEGMQGLVLAATFANLPKEARMEAAGLLLQHPTAKLTQHLLARLTESSLGLAVDGELSMLIDQLLREPDSPDRANGLASVLAGGKAELLLERITLDKARGSRDLITAYLEASLMVGQANHVLEVTADLPRESLSPSAGLVLRARAYAKLGDRENTRESLGKAIELAADDDLALLERNIRETQDKRLLLDYFERLTDHPKAGPFARASAASTAYELGDEERMDQHLASVDPAVLRLMPDLQRRILYLMLVRNIRSAETLRLSENYYAMAGTTQPAKLLLAFANARAGRFDIARTLTDGISAHDLRLPEESVMFYYACSTEVSSMPEDAGKGMSSFERDLLTTRSPLSG